MSIINKARAEELAQGIWAKTKIEIGNPVTEVAKDPNSDNIVVTKKDGSTTNIDLSYKAFLNEDNAFTGNNSFSGSTTLIGDTFVADAPYIQKLVDNNSGFASNKYSGYRDFTSHANGNDGYVDYIKIRIVPTKNVGETIPNIYVAAIEKKDAITNDVVLEYIAQNKSFSVAEDAEFGKHIVIPVKKQFTKEVYFAIGNSSSTNRFLRECIHGEKPETLNINFNQLPQVGSAGIPATTVNWTIQIGIVGRGVNLRDFIKQTPRSDWSNLDYVTRNNDDKVVIDSENVLLTFDKNGTSLKADNIHDAVKEIANTAGAGTVKSVNGQMPDPQGAVTLDASHFNDIYSKTEVDDKFVPKTEVGNEANKIPVLGADGKLVNSVLPKITLNETVAITATDQVDLETQAMALTVENGDMIVAQVGATPDTITKKYLCIDNTQTTFADKFIELSFPSDGVTEAELQAALANYVLISNTGVGANQVLRLDGEGKIDDTNLKIATSEEINAIIDALN